MHLVNIHRHLDSADSLTFTKSLSGNLSALCKAIQEQRQQKKAFKNSAQQNN